MLRTTVALASALAMVLPAPGAAQARTLFHGGIESGGFGGPSVRLTGIRGEPHVLVGGRGGWIIDHAVVIGGGGWGLATEVELDPLPQGSAAPLRRTLELGYGGLEVTGILRSDDLVHLTVSLLAGGGGAVARREGAADRTEEIFVLEPTVSIVVNLTRNVRLATGGGYRYVAGLPSDFGVTDEELSAPYAELMVKFGSF